MGEAADDAIDRGIDEWLSGEYDDEDFCYTFCPRLHSCRYCRVANLHWNLLNGKWRLFDTDGGTHRCVPKAKEVFK